METRYAFIELQPAHSGFGIYTWTEKPMDDEYYTSKSELIAEIENMYGRPVTLEADLEANGIANISGLIENQWGGEVLAYQSVDGLRYGMIVKKDFVIFNEAYVE